MNIFGWVIIIIWAMGFALFYYAVESDDGAVTYDSKRVPFIVRQLVAAAWPVWCVIAFTQAMGSQRK